MIYDVDYTPEAMDLFVRFIKSHYSHYPHNREVGRFDRNVAKIVELIIAFGTSEQARQLVQTLDQRLTPEEFQVLVEVVADDKEEAAKLLQDEDTILSSNHCTILQQV